MSASWGEEIALEDYDVEVAQALTEEEDEQREILSAFSTSRTFDSSLIPMYQESGAYIGYWYSVAKRRKRAANGDKQDWQFYEDYLEAAVKALSTALMASMSVNKTERFTVG